MSLPKPVKPTQILFDLHDVPNWVPPDFITEEGSWISMAFIPIPSIYKSLLIGSDGTSLRTLGRCTSTVVEIKTLEDNSCLVIYGLERFNTRMAFNKLIEQVDIIKNKIKIDDNDDNNGIISSYCINQ